MIVKAFLLSRMRTLSTLLRNRKSNRSQEHIDVINREVWQWSLLLSPVIKDLLNINDYFLPFFSRKNARHLFFFWPAVIFAVTRKQLLCGRFSFSLALEVNFRRSPIDDYRSIRRVKETDSSTRLPTEATTEAPIRGISLPRYKTNKKLRKKTKLPIQQLSMRTKTKSK